MSDTLLDRIVDKIEFTSGCWLWTAGKTHGYGYVFVKPGVGMQRAHRVIYELVVSPIPAGLEIDHLCHTPACVNPDHLEPVPTSVNRQRQRTQPTNGNERKTHCPAGHPYDPANTYRDPSGRRTCRTCRRIRGHAYDARRRARSTR